MQLNRQFALCLAAMECPVPGCYGMPCSQYVTQTWLILGGLTGCRPDGVSAMMWKCDVGGGPMDDGLFSASTW